MELHNIGFDSMYFLYIVLYTGSFYANTIWIYMQMTQEEIIKLAREADLVTWLSTSKRFSSGVWWIEAHELDDCLFKFAELVAQRERERLTDAAMKAAEKAVDVAMALEREACIDIVAMFGGSIEIEAAIRARGQA